MPTAPLRLCAAPFCPNLVPKGRCVVHAQQQEQQRGSKRDRGYTRRWERLAKHFKALYPLCGMRPNEQAPVMSQCYDEQRTTAAYQVDHVIPHRGESGLFWDSEWNWQSLCAACGARKTRAGL